ncbi:MAG: hypothetical protein KDK99_03935 [Verrucomicrobiales bacterium]|nr:hypothetical protein [Verrucomicrobiales bacterium]
MFHPVRSQTALLCAICALCTGSKTVAKSEFDAYSLPPHYEEQASHLRSAQPQQYDFAKAMLADVLRFLATDAGISFFSLPDDSDQGERLITFSIKASPFQVLETLCRANGLSLVPDNGIWYIRPADDRELVGKSYEIRHNALERVERIVDTGNSRTYSSNGQGINTSAASGLNLQGMRETFEVSPSEIIDDIRAILDLPPASLDNGSGTANTAIPGIPSTLGASNGAGSALGLDEAAAAAINSNELSAYRRPKVIWKSDSNTLYVVATRLQHLWVEGYLSAADKRQPMIAIEVKFIETARDPRREFGVDWTGTFEDGNFRKVSEITRETDSNGNPYNSINYDQVATTGGYRTDLSPLLSGVNLNNIAGTLGWPSFSVLSAQDINVKLRALLRDETTTTTSYPRMVTLNNREVAIRSVVNQPVLAAQSSATLGTGATTTQSIEYLPIGTVLNILPKRMDDDRILLNMAITVSSIVGSEMISGNPYPIASSRVYGAPVEVDSGYTVAVGGLNEAREREGETGVPFLSKIPLLGYAFKYKNRSKNHKNLMLFITPTLIDPRNGGLPAEPQSVLPQRPASELPHIPRVDQNSGALVGGADSVPNAVSYLQREFDVLHQTVHEARGTDEDTEKLKELGVAVDHLRTQVEQLQLSQPSRSTELGRYLQQLGQIRRQMSELRYEMFKRKHL